MPVVAVGLITDFEQAEAIVGTGDADLDRPRARDPLRPALAVARRGALRRERGGAEPVPALAAVAVSRSVHDPRPPLRRRCPEGDRRAIDGRYKRLRSRNIEDRSAPADCPRDRSTPVDREGRRRCSSVWAAAAAIAVRAASILATPEDSRRAGDGARHAP